MSDGPSEWDIAELQTVTWVLGIPHPTGFPLFVMTGWAFAHLLPIGTVAFRVNLLCALCAAAACRLLYETAVVLTASRIVALVASVWFAVTDAVWTHAARADVHDMSLALCAAAIYAGVRFFALRGIGRRFAPANAPQGDTVAPQCDTVARFDKLSAGSQRDTFLVVSALLWALALAAHLGAVWLLPGMLWLFAVALVTRRVSSGVALRVVAALAIGAVCYAYLPLRSWWVVSHHVDPASTLAGMENGTFIWDYNRPSTWAGFWREVTGSDFGASKAFFAAFNLLQLQNAVWEWFGSLNAQFGVYGIVAAVVGFYELLRRRWIVAVFLLASCMGTAIFSYGYAAEGDPDRYRLLSFWFAAVSIAAAYAPFARLRFLQVPRVVFTGFLVASLVGTYVNTAAVHFELAKSTNQQLIDRVRRVVPPGTLLVTLWPSATTLAYGAYVEGTFADRLIVPSWPSSAAPHYLAWSKVRPVYVLSTEAVYAAGLVYVPWRLAGGTYLYRFDPKALRGGETGRRNVRR
ncbi:MAG: DUF2723 domain-containing protein [Candidatus Eremiobacteraeota bacterium]|nr:DUF2723 domain-containing protein [Candidatus Eremiobacteraeota bacterium]